MDPIYMGKEQVSFVKVSCFAAPSIQLKHGLRHLTSLFGSVIMTTTFRGCLTIQHNHGLLYAACTDGLYACSCFFSADAEGKYYF